MTRYASIFVAFVFIGFAIGLVLLRVLELLLWWFLDTSGVGAS